MTIRAQFLVALLLAPFFTSCQSPPSEPSAPEPAAARPTQPGPQPDGSMLLHNAWSLRPAGRQVEVGVFPVNIAVHPGGQFAAVLHSGYGPQEVVVVDLRTGTVASRAPVHETFYGLEFSQDGRQLFYSGAGDEVIHTAKFENGQLSETNDLPVRERTKTGVPAGLAVDAAARRLYLANVWGHRVTELDLDRNGHASDILLNPDAAPPTQALVAGAEDSDTAAALKRAEAVFYEGLGSNSFPYACRLDERRQRLYVSLWAKSAVVVIDLKANQVVDRWPTQEHPCEMALTRSGGILYVANANRNTVTVINTATGQTLETISTALYPNSLPGATPNSLALSPDEKTLFVANATINDIAVFDVSTPGKSRSRGFIPVGWYPTSVRVTPDGKHLLVANGRGVAALPNPNGSQPGLSRSNRPPEMKIGNLFRGTLSIIDLPQGAALDRQLAAWTADACICSPLRSDNGVVRTGPPGSPIPSLPGQPSPIQYCVYIIKENRTYDQVLGDMPEGKGDPSLCLFPEKTTPNQHKLARDFVLLDSFYVDAEVSADGHEWSMGAYATDFVTRMWPFNYGHNQSRKFPYPAEGEFSIAEPSGGYLWDRAKEAGVSYRSYGEFIVNGATAKLPATTRLKNLAGHFDPLYRGFDLDYSDLARAQRYIAELRRFEQQGDMPRLQIVRLPDDHTHGTSRGFPTPAAYVARNDAALGMVVEALTHSRFWPQTAIFILEDDSQDGPDHIDAHRSPAYVISPYTRRGAVDSTMYSTCSLVRTMELILGLKPMTQFDAAAVPMFNVFQSLPDLRPFDPVAPSVAMNEMNSGNEWGANLHMDFTREDAADDLLLNEAIWRSVRGANSAMPAPVRAAFVNTHPAGQDED